MWHLPPRRRLVLLAAVGLSLVAVTFAGVRWVRSIAGDDGPVALDALAHRFYEAQGEGDVDRFASLWDSAAPDLAERRTRLRTVLATFGRIDVGAIAIADTTQTLDRATIEIDVVMRAFEPTSGALAEGFGRLRRVMECVRHAEGWKVSREYAIEERLADALLASEDAGTAELAAAPSVSKPALYGAFLRRADERQRAGEVSRALDALALAHRVARETGDEIQAARMLAGIGRLHLRQGDYRAALDYYTRALAAPEAAGDADGRADALADLGWVHLRLGDYARALEALQQSIAIRERRGHHASTGEAVRGIGVVHLFQGDYDHAETYTGRALAVGEKLDDTTLVASALSNLGAIEHERGNYEGALTYYGKGVALGDAIERPALAMLLGNIGLVHRLQGRPDLAREALTRSLALSEALGARSQIASALLNLGLVERYQGNNEKALEYYERSLTLGEASGDKRGASLVMNSIGLLHQTQGRHDLALDYYRRSLAISEEIGGLPRIAQTLANLTTAHYARGEFAQALAAARRAVRVSRETGHGGEVLWSSLAAMGRAYRRLGRPDRARAVLEESVAALEHMRAEAGGSAQDQQGFLESRLLAYHEMTDLLAADGDTFGALAYAERAKARVLLDVLQRGRVNITKAMTAGEREREETLRAQLSALNGRLRRERGRASAERPQLEPLEADVGKARLAYEAFQTSLYAAHPELKVQRGEASLFAATDAHAVLPDARTAAIEFMVSKEQTLLFVLTRQSEGPAATLRVHRLPVTRDELTALVTELRTLVAERNLRVRELAMRLFRILIEPAAEELAGKSALVIVPDDVLWELPFQALQPAPGRYLIEDYAVSYAPSLTVLRETGRLRRPGHRAPPRTLLAFGNPDLGDPSAETSRTRPIGDLVPLPEAERQIERLHQLYGEDRSRTYVGTEAREARAKAEAGDYRILHFATHGVLDDRNPMSSYVVLSQTDPSDEEDGLLEAWELMTLDLDADLVVLSACETGRGRFGAGEGVIGMSWAAFVAGSPATVVSLWKVESRSTTELMVEFHRRLLAEPEPGHRPPSKAEALQHAALTLLQDSRYRHPFYWAGFVMVGSAAPASRDTSHD